MINKAAMSKKRQERFNKAIQEQVKRQVKSREEAMDEAFTDGNNRSTEVIFASFCLYLKEKFGFTDVSDYIRELEEIDKYVAEYLGDGKTIPEYLDYVFEQTGVRITSDEEIND